MKLHRFLATVVACAAFYACSSSSNKEKGKNENPGSSGGGSACAGPECPRGSGGASAGTGGAPPGSGGGSGGSSLASGGSGATPIPGPCDRLVDTTSYDFSTNIPPSRMPPGGLSVDETPLFVALGFDDNPLSDGMLWATDLFVAESANVTFFHSTKYALEAQVQWRAAYDAGFEVALHTVQHETSSSTPQSVWASETTGSIVTLTAAQSAGGLGVPRSEIYGSRAPFLQLNDGMLTELENHKVWYDSSIQDGYGTDLDGTNHYFPYTLDGPSPGHTVNRAWGFPANQFELTSHPGLFELPVYTLIVPPDSLAFEYDFPPGLRDRANVAGIESIGYKLTGFDWNLWVQARLDADEVLAILKYNFDLRRAGNRAPFLFGAHTADYSSSPARREAIEKFIAYVKTFPEVRIVSYKEVFDFMREPKPLNCY